MTDHLKTCLEKMIHSYEMLEDAKAACKDAVDRAYNEYGATLEFGDDVVPDKALKKLAQAMARRRDDDLAIEVADLVKAFQKTKEITAISLPVFITN